jgi:integrase
MSKATVTLFFDTRASKDATGILKYLTTCERKQRLVTTGRKITAQEWEFLKRYKGGLTGRVKDDDLRNLWNECYGQFTAPDGTRQDGYLVRGQNVVNRLGDIFTFDDFADGIQHYGKEKKQPTDQTDVLAALARKAQAMHDAGRVGNALPFENVATSLRRFVNSFTDAERKEFLGIAPPRRKTTETPAVVLRFEHVTAAFLTIYESWMLTHGKAAKSPVKPDTGASLTTVGMYLRHLRVSINEAIEAGTLPPSAYPFGPGKYTIPAGSNPKKALSKEDLEKLKAYEPIPGTLEQRSHDLWLFSYYCNGLNFSDLCHLKWGSVDLQGNRLTFIRQKTARSNKQRQITIVAHLNAKTLAVLDRWGTSDRGVNNFVFPFLSPEMDALRRKRVVQQVISGSNKWMGRIAQSLGINANVNSYSCRHTFATQLMKSKAPIAFISKQLGHSNLKTTENYLGTFDDQQAQEFLTAL